MTGDGLIARTNEACYKKWLGAQKFDGPTKLSAGYFTM